jgi:hypothetical protein
VAQQQTPGVKVNLGCYAAGLHVHKSSIGMNASSVACLAVPSTKAWAASDGQFEELAFACVPSRCTCARV